MNETNSYKNMPIGHSNEQVTALIEYSTKLIQDVVKVIGKETATFQKFQKTKQNLMDFLLRDKMSSEIIFALREAVRK